MSLFKKQAIAIDISAEPTFFLELSPCMKSISEFNDTIWQSQVSAIKAQQDAQSDLNRVMRLAVETDKGTTTYSMVKAFKNLVSAENMLKIMADHDITMRMNIMRNDAHVANHTCMELNATALQGLIDSESEDGLKTVHLRTSSDLSKEVADHGDMYVTLNVRKNGTHSFSHVDYCISDGANARLSS
jgi:hypothetical protein